MGIAKENPMQVLQSRPDLHRHPYHRRNRSVNINIYFRSFQRNDQAIPHPMVIFTQMWTFPPPPNSRINTDKRTTCNISGCPFPNIGMQRAKVTVLRTDPPSGAVATRCSPFLFVTGGFIHSLHKFILVFIRGIDIETEAKGLVAVSMLPANFAGAWLYEIG